MTTIVDWISISIPFTLPFDLDDDNRYDMMGEGATQKWKPLLDFMLSYEDVEYVAGRSPFQKSIHSKFGGWRYYYGATNNNSLIEISGRGCEQLRNLNADETVMKMYADHITRIDIAVDIETPLDPVEFAKHRTVDRYKSGGDFRSAAGKTVYVGSRKSDRYSRVYRYYDPHPRAPFLRVEMVCKGRSVASLLEMHGSGASLDDLAASMGLGYGWSHPVWELRSDTKVAAAPRRHKQGQTERWLITQVIPACNKLGKQGAVEVLQFLVKQVTIIINDNSRE